MNSYELIEFFGVLPTEDEDRCYEYFKIEKNGTILEFGFFHQIGFSVSIFSKGLPEPIFSMGFEGNFKIERLTYKSNFDCLEITVPFEKNYREPNWDYSYKIVIFIEPNIKVKIL